MPENVLLDPDLATIIECWAELPESVKTAVMEMMGGYEPRELPGYPTPRSI